MEFGKADRSLVRAGFVLFALALLTGFAIPAFLNQKMAVAAHLSGIMNALISDGARSRLGSSHR